MSRVPVLKFASSNCKKRFLLESIRQTAIYPMGFGGGRDDSKEARVGCEVRRFTMII
jgi:hypothetical protein